MLLYRKVRGASRRVELGCRGKSRGSRAAKLGALSPAKVNFGKVLDQHLVGVDAAAALWDFSHALPPFIIFAVIGQVQFFGEKADVSACTCHLCDTRTANYVPRISAQNGICQRGFMPYRCRYGTGSLHFTYAKTILGQI